MVAFEAEEEAVVISPLRLLSVLILGGTGFLSGTVARHFLSHGHSVTIVTRGLRRLPTGVQAIVVDRHDRLEFARLLKAGPGWDIVVDAIAFTVGDAMQDVEVFSGRTQRLVFISTDFVYDPLRRRNPQSERDAAYTTASYGGRKREAELILENTPKSILPWTVLRPSHIYGPGSWLGCLPFHGRDPLLVEHILQRRPLRLVEGGRYLQHPIFASDLAEMILEVATRPSASGQIFNIAGPDIVESHVYYRILGEILNREILIQAVPVNEFLAMQPEKAPFCCDRTYDLSAMKSAGLLLPATSLKEGLQQQLEALPPVAT